MSNRLATRRKGPWFQLREWRERNPRCCSGRAMPCHIDCGLLIGLSGIQNSVFRLRDLMSSLCRYGSRLCKKGRRRKFSRNVLPGKAWRGGAIANLNRKLPLPRQSFARDFDWRAFLHSLSQTRKPRWWARQDSNSRDRMPQLRLPYQHMYQQGSATSDPLTTDVPPAQLPAQPSALSNRAESSPSPGQNPHGHAPMEPPDRLYQQNRSCTELTPSGRRGGPSHRRRLGRTRGVAVATAAAGHQLGRGRQRWPRSQARLSPEMGG